MPYDALIGPPKTAVLSAPVREVLSRLENDDIREQVDTTMRYVVAALDRLGEVSIPADYLSDDHSYRSHRDYLAVAPHVLSAIGSINRLLGYLIAAFPLDLRCEEQGEHDLDDLELEFDLMDMPNRVELGFEDDPLKPAPETEQDRLVMAANTFGAILRDRCLTFASHLEKELKSEDQWFFVAELDEGISRLRKAVQGVYFGILETLSKEYSREQLLPEYRSALGDAIVLRRTVVNLRDKILRLRVAAEKEQSGDLWPMASGLAEQLERFSKGATYRLMRPKDKSQVRDFRIALQRWRKPGSGVSREAMMGALDHFCTSLESILRINQRDVLIAHDSRILAEALARLQKAGEVAENDPELSCLELDDIIGTIAPTLGRQSELDYAIRSHKNGRFTPEILESELTRWYAVIESVLAELEAAE